MNIATVEIKDELHKLMYMSSMSAGFGQDIDNHEYTKEINDLKSMSNDREIYT